MKTTILAAVTALSITAAAAHAESEGAGDRFAFSTPGVTVVGPQLYADTGSAAYLDLRGHPSRIMTAGGSDEVPVTGSEGTVQTANSLPRGFVEGTAAYAQNRSVQRNLAEQAARLTQASRTALVSGRRPRS